MPASATIDSAEGRTDSITNFAARTGSVTVDATETFFDEVFFIPEEDFLALFFDVEFLVMLPKTK
jgi:hypothetical protein